MSELTYNGSSVKAVTKLIINVIATNFKFPDTYIYQCLIGSCTLQYQNLDPTCNKINIVI